MPTHTQASAGSSISTPNASNSSSSRPIAPRCTTSTRTMQNPPQAGPIGSTVATPQAPTQALRTTQQSQTGIQSLLASNAQSQNVSTSPESSSKPKFRWFSWVGKIVALISGLLTIFLVVPAYIKSDQSTQSSLEAAHRDKWNADVVFRDHCLEKEKEVDTLDDACLQAIAWEVSAPPHSRFSVGERDLEDTGMATGRGRSPGHPGYDRELADLHPLARLVVRIVIYVNAPSWVYMIFVGSVICVAAVFPPLAVSYVLLRWARGRSGLRVLFGGVEGCVAFFISAQATLLLFALSGTLSSVIMDLVLAALCVLLLMGLFTIKTGLVSPIRKAVLTGLGVGLFAALMSRRSA